MTFNGRKMLYGSFLLIIINLKGYLGLFYFYLIHLLAVQFSMVYFLKILNYMLQFLVQAGLQNRVYNNHRTVTMRDIYSHSLVC